jgi:hypothetical protein
MALVWLVPTALAGGGNSANAKLCQKSGYLNLQSDNGGSFATEEDCTSYAAQGGTLFNPTVTASPTTLHFVSFDGSNYLTDFTVVTVTGFHANSTGPLDININGVSGTFSSLTTDASGALQQPMGWAGAVCSPKTFTATFTFTDASGVHATSNPVTVDLSCPT